MRFLITIALSAAVCVAQEATPSRNLLTNRDVVTLAEAGFGIDFILEVIGASRPEFDTTADAIADVKKHGVKEDVIRAMMKARRAGSGPANLDFGERAQPVRVFVQVALDSRRPEPYSQTAEIVQVFASNCPALLLTSRRSAATFLITLEQTRRMLLIPPTSKMVVSDRSGDTIYGSNRGFAKAVRGFCPLASNRAAGTQEESLPGSRLSAR